MSKVAWSGEILAVQPRIDRTRSFDERQHTYLGYLLLVAGTAEAVARTFTVRIGPGAHSRHRLRAGMRVSGVAEPRSDPDRECADYYKVSALKVDATAATHGEAPPPWRGVPPPLDVYRERGHRRLDARTYDRCCRTCQWGCRMAVTLIVDHWNPRVRRCRFERFCYGPKSCSLYRPGPTRKVPGRKGMSWEEEDRVDEDATTHRAPDE